MVTCCRCSSCEGLERQFGRETAERDLRRFRRRGPIPSTRQLIDDLRARGVSSASVLDIGGGIGAIHHALLDAGASSAIQIDVSQDYINAAREEAGKRAHLERVRFVHGDFVEHAGELPDADIVTLDRVICCYPNMDALVGRAAAKARRLLGAVFPRDVWWMRAGVRTINLLMRLRRSEFRVYVHPTIAIDEVLRRHGLEPSTRHRTLAWEIAVYARGAS